MERPILFNTEMVQAILDGRKTSTRRIIKPQPKKSIERDSKNRKPLAFWKDCSEWVKPPYQVGDTLWVRETWQYIDFAGENNGYVYKASQNGKDWEQNSEGWKWRPSIFMPHEAARIFLKVTDVKAERLQDITEDETLKEGIMRYSIADNAPKAYGDNLYIDPKLAFKALWNSTIKKKDLNKYGWDANPWVWAIEFERK